MAAYVISEVEVLDPALVEEYRSLAQATIAVFLRDPEGNIIELMEGYRDEA